MQPADNSPRAELSPVKRALLEIRELRAQLRKSEQWKREPIAIVGAGLRFPGNVSTPEEFWELLISGSDAITAIPPDRWDTGRFFDPDPEQLGRMTSQHGAFISGVDQFDPEFFGITPREAVSMDPQHRLILEVAWEALERSGIAPHTLAGTQTGVFLGISNSDYARKLLAEPQEINTYSVLGGAGSIAAGRLSYLLGAHGPSVVLDTSCSSSLVAIHLACQSLRSGESSLAIAGGCNLILSPEGNIGFSKTRMLAPDGHCKTFDAAADGYVRGEGCGVVVLKRLSEATDDGDRILAVIRGSAVNQDGRSAGITAPNGPAQELVIRTALENAGIDASEVDYVETHGTGTPLGDPIEVRALAAVYGKDRLRSNPLLIGSVKTNVGHLEAAAGIAGLLKIVLSLHQGTLPPHRNLKQLSPYIEWDSIPVEVLTVAREWTRGERRRLAGVSSFGFSGTNAHIILEGAPAIERAALETERPVHVLCLSAKTDTALQELARAYVAHLSAPKDSFADICFTANAGRTHHAHRLAVRAASTQGASDYLAGWLAGEQSSNIVAGVAGEAAPEIAFLFPGQGAQYRNMGSALYATSQVFRRAMDRCAEIGSPLLSKPLLSVIFAPEGDEIDETEWTQPALFAVEYALAELWRSWNIRPSIVVGHSLGEYVAACVAGVLSLEDALTLVVRRAALMHSLPPGGAMAAIAASEQAVQRAIASDPDLSIAAVNGPDDIVVSGAQAQVTRLAEHFAAHGIRTKILRISNAFHSPLVEPMLDEFERAVVSAHFSEPRIAFLSNLTGRLENSLLRTPSYWRRHTREAVRFGDGIRTLAERGEHVLLEVGPHPTLGPLVARAYPEQIVLPSLRNGRCDWEQIGETLQYLYVLGANISWAAFDNERSRAKTLLPTYPFQRKRYWLVPENAEAEQRRSAWNGVAAAADRQSEVGPLGWNVRNYRERLANLGRLTFAHARHVLVQIGAFQNAGESYTVQELSRNFGISPMYARLIDRWLRGLASQGLLQIDGDKFVSREALSDVDLAPFWNDVESNLAGETNLIAYLRNCGTKLAGVITGREAALETLFPGGSFEIAEGIYQHSSEGRYINQVAAAAVATAARLLPAKGGIRILEAGAGTGGTTASVLPVLPAENTEYWFTDVSDQFLATAAGKFSAFPFVRYVRMDLDSPLEPQGIPEHAFDIVIAANVVHATRNLDATLDRIRRALVPGGLMILVESTRHHTFFDMSTGLIEGWQHFSDSWRTHHPLLGPEKWLEVLAANDFESAACYPGKESLAAAIGQQVVLAQSPSAATSRPSSPVTPAHVQAFTVVAAAGQGTAEFLPKLNAAMDAERHELILGFVHDRVRQVLRLDADRELGPRERLTDLGMDSLMALELKTALGKGLRLEGRIPSTIAFDAGSVEELARYLSRLMFPEKTSTRTKAASAGVKQNLSAEEAGELSDDDIERLLMARLAGDRN